MLHGVRALCHGIFRSVLDFLFPPVCLQCRRRVSEPGNLCADCWREIAFIDGAQCASCGLPFEAPTFAGARCAACLASPPAFDAARAVMRYDEKCKASLLAFKHADRLDLAPSFAHWLIRAGGDFITEMDTVVPVPLHRSRLWSRRYNQAAELARALAQRTGKAFRPFALERVRRTPSQGEMPSAIARRRNVAGAFRVRDTAKVAGRTVLLIDDVLTTGATADACARALKRAGASKVLVLALARVVRPQ